MLLYVAGLCYGLAVPRFHRIGSENPTRLCTAGLGRAVLSARSATLAFLVSALLCVAAPFTSHAQQIPPWAPGGAGTVEISRSTVDLSVGQTGSYSIRLSHPPSDGNGNPIPNDKEWWVLVHIDGARRPDGNYKGIRILPSIGRTFDNADWNTWKDIRVETDPDYDGSDGPRATSLTFTHEVWDHDSNCPVHNVGRVGLDIQDSGNSGGNDGGNSGGNDGGNSGGNDGGNSGGNDGRNDGGNDGGNSGGNSGGNDGGNSGGNDGGNSGGNDGGSSGGNDGGSSGGNDGGNSGGNSGGNDGGSSGGNDGGANRNQRLAEPVLSISDAATTEGGTLRFRVTLSPADHEAISVEYRTADGTAEAASDYNPATGTLHFVPGTTSRFIEVETLKDDIDESNETLTVTLSNPIPSESTWLGDAVGVGTVIGDVERRIRLANRAYLPEMARAAAFNAVKCRIDRAPSRTAPGSLKQALDRLAPPAPPSLGLRRPHARTVGIERLLGSLAFALQSNGRSDGVGHVAAWSCGDYRGLADGAGDGRVDWDGHLANLQLGADVRVRPGLVAGLGFSRSTGTFRYEVGRGAAEVDGEHELRMNGIHPYLVWSPTPDMTVWGTFGRASGDLDISDRLGGKQRGRAVTLTSAMLGASRRVLARGPTTVTLKGEAGLARFGVDDPGVGFGASAASMQRLKLAAEAAHEYELASGGSLGPWGEIGLRHDGGDGETGGGIELGGGLRYRDPAKGWTVEGFGRRRMVRGNSLPKEWGAGGTFRVDPDAFGAGFSASLTQSWGEAGNGTERLWDRDEPDRDGLPGRRLELQVGYGFPAPGGRGVLTPFAAMTLDGRSGRGYRWGGRLDVGPGATLSLEAERREPHRAGTVHRVMLRGELRFQGP